ncbi:MAG: hypothetical protein ACE5EX_00390 [Phycisphaerae bacterium]
MLTVAAVGLVSTAGFGQTIASNGGGLIDADGDGMADGSTSSGAPGPAPPTQLARVAVFGGSNASALGMMDRVESLGYAVTRWTDPAEVNAASLAAVDVLFVYTGVAHELAAQAAPIADWVFQGNGLIVEQPNREGYVPILPIGLDISVWSLWYDGSGNGPDPVRNVQITSLGASHEIMASLTTADICENSDRVLTADVSSAYDILGVQASNNDYVAVAAAAYGAGRVLFQTGNTNPQSFAPGSDRYVRQMIDWTANVPPPTGACCDGATGICQDSVLENDCGGARATWIADTPCSAVSCAEPAGACCVDGACTENVPRSQCTGPTWVEGTTCNDPVIAGPCADQAGIPTLSGWGMAILALALLAAARVYFLRRGGARA